MLVKIANEVDAYRSDILKTVTISSYRNSTFRAHSNETKVCRKLPKEFWNLKVPPHNGDLLTTMSYSGQTLTNMAK